MNQAQLISVLQYLFPNVLRGNGYTIAVDGSGNATIALWNNNNGAQPSPAQLTAALATITLTQAQATQAAVIGAAFNVATLQTPIAYMSTTFWTDQNSQFMLLGAAWGYGQAGAVPSGFTWWDATGKAVAMTLAQLQGLAQAVLGMYNTNFQKQKGYLAQIAAATTVAAVQAVVWA